MNFFAQLETAKLKFHYTNQISFKFRVYGHHHATCANPGHYTDDFPRQYCYSNVSTSCLPSHDRFTTCIKHVRKQGHLQVHIKLVNGQLNSY